ncbi:MAG: AbrB/MazE/SpoVT family DNA-binding domain-containing protein [Gemmatimonadetes bacterium]|nr:AbrB/MazE/SpoVT family DNA-binding domain-containing protein [Gemmatimonadota bacterium]
MLVRITSMNQLTLPKDVTEELGTPEYFDVESRNGQLILTPVRLHRADAVRARFVERGVTNADLDDAVAWARRDETS